MKLPTLFKKKDNFVNKQLLKNDEALLDVMSKNIKGARQCPMLGGRKCLGQFCEHFMEFSTYDSKTKTSTPFYRCAHVQSVLLQIETNRNLLQLIEKIEKIK